MCLGVRCGKGHKKSRHFLTVTGNKEYVCPYGCGLQMQKSMPFEILEVVCVQCRAKACRLAEQSGNLFLVLC